MQMNKSVGSVNWAQPGTAAGLKTFEQFTRTGLKNFDIICKDSNQQSICSSLSPWINHGHISFQQLALAVKKLNEYANQGPYCNVLQWLPVSPALSLHPLQCFFLLLLELRQEQEHLQMLLQSLQVVQVDCWRYDLYCP
jgi:hypothetical protein